jgi:hypothetical protein
VSLRTDVHAAFDELAPSTFGLPERVIQTALSEAPRRRRETRLVFRLRAPMALVAALALIALAVGALLGGSLLRDWQNWSTAHPKEINQVEVQKLELRPVLPLPVVQPGGTCPVSAFTDVSSHSPEAIMFGDGPAYGARLGYSAVRTDWGTWSYWHLLVDPAQVKGLILIRGKDLETGAPVAFASTPLEQVTEAGTGIPTGQKTGTDTISGVMEPTYVEEVLDMSRPFVGTKKGDWPIFTSLAGYPKGASSCFGFQLDGTRADGSGFTELVIVSS